MIYFLLHTVSCVALIYGAFKVCTLLNRLSFNIILLLIIRFYFLAINYFNTTIYYSGIHKTIYHILLGDNIYDSN